MANITEPEEEKTFKIYAVDANNHPLANIKLNLNVPMSNNNAPAGSLDKYEVTTDENGLAQVTYTAPKNISDLNQATIKVSTLNNKSANITIKFSLNDNKVSKLIVIPSKLSNVAANFSTSLDIYTLNAQNRPISDTVFISIPIKNNISYGKFNTYKITTDDNGYAKVIYTAPNKVKNGDEYNVSFSSSNGIITILPIDFISNEPVKRYKLNVQIPNALSVDTKNFITIDVKDNEGNDVSVNKIHITSENGLISFESSHSNYMTKNNVDMPDIENIKTSIHSGIDILKINVSVDNDHNLTKEVPITLISGPVSTISINKLGTPKFNNDNGLIEQTYILHAVDKFGNPAQSGTKMYVGLVAGVKVEGNESGTLIANSPAEFNDSNKVNFNNKNVKINDTLIVVPNKKKFNPSYLGGWNIDSIIDNYNLGLDKDYNLTENNLSYIIGNERRFIGNGIYTADVDKENKIYEVQQNGNSKIIVRYDPELSGHTFFLYADFIQNNIKRGDAIKDFLRPNKLSVIDSGGNRGYFDFTNNLYSSLSVEYISPDDNTHETNDTLTLSIVNSDNNIYPAVNLIVKNEDFVKNAGSTEGCSFYLESNTTNNEGKIKLHIKQWGTDNNDSTHPTCIINYIPTLHYEY